MNRSKRTRSVCAARRNENVRASSIFEGERVANPDENGENHNGLFPTRGSDGPPPNIFSKLALDRSRFTIRRELVCSKTLQNAMASSEASGLLDAFETLRRTNAAHASALDALERAFTAETVGPPLFETSWATFTSGPCQCFDIFVRHRQAIF